MAFDFGSVLKVAGTVIDAYGNYKAGKDARDVYQFNEALAKYEADYIQEKADVELAALKRDVGKYISRSRAIQGKSGTVVDKGSNLDAIIATEREAEIDAAVIRRTAEVQSYLTMQGADLYSTQAGQVYNAGLLNTGSTILGGLSKWDYKTSLLSSPSKTSTSPTGPYNIGQYGTTAYGI